MIRKLDVRSVSPFFWDRKEWIPVPANWNRSIMRGKTYSTDEPIGQDLWTKVQNRLESHFWFNEEFKEAVEEPERYGKEFLTKTRLGQGAFRVWLPRRTKGDVRLQERTLPVLQAAHIKPYSMDGPHNVENGILFRSDLHILFNGGYITVTPDRKVEVSRSIKEEFENGRDYYAFHGKNLLILPQQIQEQPSAEFLAWHNENVYLG